MLNFLNLNFEQITFFFKIGSRHGDSSALGEARRVNLEQSIRPLGGVTFGASSLQIINYILGPLITVKRWV